MKKIDYLIFTGLVVSLILFLYLTSLSSSSQNAAILQNQELIKNNSQLAANASANAEQASTQAIDAARIAADTRQKILTNQQIIIGLANDSHQQLQTQQKIIDRMNTFETTLGEHLNDTRARFASIDNASSS
jgi:hypothetical protein